MIRFCCVDVYIPGWANEPIMLTRVDGIPNNEIWSAHIRAKTDLLEFIRGRSGVEMEIRVLTIGFARRATGYKRAPLICEGATFIPCHSIWLTV